MSKDYKHRVPGSWRKPPQRKRHSDWFWAIPAVLVSAVVFAVFRFGHFDKDPAAPPREAAPADHAAVDPKKSKNGGKDGKDAKPPKPPKSKPDKVPDIQLPEPRFTFYKILPEKEVIVSESEIRELARDEKAGKAETSATYMIQAGSFSRLEDAEKLRARLAEVQVRAKTEKVLIENATWYRVKMGPYKSLVDAERVRSHLRRNSVDSVMQQAKPPK